jgi:hypothetical protein
MLKHVIGMAFLVACIIQISTSTMMNKKNYNDDVTIDQRTSPFIPVILVLVACFFFASAAWAARACSNYGYNQLQFTADIFITFGVVTCILFIY